SEPIANEPTDTQGGHLRARWSRTRRNGATLQIQSSLEIEGRQEPIGDYHRRAFDIDSQYHIQLGAHQDLVAGTSYRFTDEQLLGTVGLSLTPPEDRSSL